MGKIKILVSGLLSYDSGKTTVAKYLAKILREKGFDIGVSKPVAGHSLWLQPYTYEYSMSYKKLVGEDVVELKKYSGSNDSIEMINPLNMATLPLDPLKFLTIDLYYNNMSMINTYKLAVISRLTRCVSKDYVETTHFIIEDRYRLLSDSLRRSIDKLSTNLEPKPEPVSSEEFYKKILEASIDTDRCLEILEDKHEFLIIESFNDVASPNIYSLKSDLVLIIAPGRVFIYSGERFREVFKMILYIDSLEKIDYINISTWPLSKDLVRYIREIDSIEIPHILDRELFIDSIYRLSDKILSLLSYKQYSK